MKRKFLEDLGLEKEVIDKILDEAGADLEKSTIVFFIVSFLSIFCNIWRYL